MGFLKFFRVQWDRSLGGTCVAAGAILLVVGWAQVSRSVYASQQVPYVLSCGLGGLFVLGVGATLWLSADLRDEWRHLEGMETRLSDRVDAMVEAQLHGENVASEVNATDGAANPSLPRPVRVGSQP